MINIKWEIKKPQAAFAEANLWSINNSLFFQ